MPGNELLFESGMGPHFGYFPEYPELTTVFHPSMGMPVDLPKHRSCPTELLFNKQLTGIHFFEVANGWARLAMPEPVTWADEPFSWRADRQWDDLLDDGCLLWGTGSGDAYQAIKTGILKHEREHGYLLETEPGTAYNVICVNAKSTKEEMVSAVRRGCFYFTTGVDITDIQVVGTQITVTTSNSMRITATTNKGIVLAQTFAATLCFDPWECLAKLETPVEATYVRVTCTRATHLPSTQGNLQQSRHDAAWTQPFWLTLDGFSLARDRRLQNVATLGDACPCLKREYGSRFESTFLMRHCMADHA